MPKVRTHSGAKDRVKRNKKSKKIVKGKVGAGHLRRKEDSNAKSAKKQSSSLNKGFTKKFTQLAQV